MSLILKDSLCNYPLRAIIHAVRAIFEDNNTHTGLLVDATNAFNPVNHQAAPHNISVLCLSFSTILKGTYCVNTTLFIKHSIITVIKLFNTIVNKNT